MTAFAPHILSRRQLLVASAAAAAALPVLGCGQETTIAEAPAATPPAGGVDGQLQTRPIPVSGEQLPVTGMGTSQIYEYDNDPIQHAERRETLQTFVNNGATLIDTAPSYGNAETNLGLLIEDLGIRDRIFLSTKIRARDDAATRQASLEESQRRLKTSTFDVMFAHNITGTNEDFAQLREWKEQGIARYWGITTANDNQYGAVVEIIRRDRPDFLQIDYSLENRNVEDMVLPVAQEHGVAVMTSLPFGRNSLFRRVGDRPLPEWAAEIDATSWAQVFLKFLLSNPAINAVIPGTDKPEYALDNIRAGSTVLPNAAQRQQIVDWWESLPA